MMMILHLGSCTSMVYKIKRRSEIDIEDWRRNTAKAVVSPQKVLRQVGSDNIYIRI